MSVPEKGKKREELGSYYRNRFKYMSENYPDFSAETVETHLNIIRTSDMIWRALSRYLRPHGLTPPSMGILLLLDSMPEPIPMSHLSEQRVVTQANVTGLIDTLEKPNWVERIPHTTDRRVTLARITANGRKKVREVFPGQIKLLKTIYSQTTKDERRGLKSVMEKIRQKLLPLLGGLLLALASSSQAAEPPTLPLKIAVQTAIERSPSLASARAALESALAQQLVLLGTYDTSLSAAISRIDAKTPPAVFFQTPRTITDAASIGLSRRFATGTSASAQSSFSKERDNVSNAFNINPRVRSNLNLSLTQSLLKGFIGRPDRTALREAEFAIRTSRADLDRAVELLAKKVTTAYWALWLGRRNKKVLEDSQAEAREFLETTRKLAKRYEAEKDDILRAEASLLSKELLVLEADEAILDREEKLRIFLAAPSLEAPLEDPAPPGDVPDLPKALAEAQSARRDLAALKNAAKRDKLHLESLRGLGLPELDFTGSFGWSGLKNRNTESLKQLGRAGFRTWSVGLDLKYSFGARTDKGTRRAAAASRMLSDARTHELRLKIDHQVKTALARLRLAKSRVEITRRLEDMQEEALKISRRKYRQARISSRDRLLASDTALTARGARIRAEADGAVAQADQKASVGGLLAWLGVSR